MQKYERRPLVSMNVCSMQGCLTWEPLQRLTPEAALEHPWDPATNAADAAARRQQARANSTQSGLDPGIESVDSRIVLLMMSCAKANPTYLMMQALGDVDEGVEPVKAHHSRLKDLGSLFRQAVAKLCA